MVLACDIETRTGVVITRSILIDTNPFAEIALCVGENGVTCRCKYESLVLTLVILWRTLRNRRVAIHTLLVEIGCFACSSDIAEFRDTLDSNEAAPIDRREAGAIQAVSNLPTVADEALLNTHHW